MLVLAVLAAACGGDDSGPSPSASNEATAGPTERLTANPAGPAQFVAVFASPEGTHAALTALAARTDVPLVLLSEASRDPASFADVAVPEGMLVTGTTPVSTARNSEDFDAAYADLTGGEATDAARQAYDAVYLVALAAIGTNSTTGGALTDGTIFVANPPGEIVGPDDFEHAKELVLDGQEVDYTGVSGFVDMTGAGQMTKGAAEIWRLVGGEALPIETRDVDAAAETGAEVPSGSLVRSAEPQEAALVLGVIGAIGIEGEPLDASTAGVMIAVEEINDAGGVFGQAIETVFEAPSQGAAQLLLDAGANVIIGPTDSASAGEAAGAAAQGEPVFVFVTTPDLSGRFFNMAPSQGLQGPVLVNLAREQDLLVACVVYEGGVGDGLVAAFQAALEYKLGRVRESAAFAAGDDLSEILNKCMTG